MDMEEKKEIRSKLKSIVPSVGVSFITAILTVFFAFKIVASAGVQDAASSSDHQKTTQDVQVHNVSKDTASVLEIARTSSPDIADLMFTKAIMMDPDQISVINEYIDLRFALLKNEADLETVGEELERISATVRGALLAADPKNDKSIIQALSRIDEFYESKADALSVSDHQPAKLEEMIKYYEEQIRSIDPDNIDIFSGQSELLAEIIEDLENRIYEQDGAEIKNGSLRKDSGDIIGILDDAKKKLERGTFNVYFSNALQETQVALDASKKESNKEYKNIMIANIDRTLSGLIPVRYKVSPNFAKRLDSIIEETKKVADDLVKEQSKKMSEESKRKMQAYNRWAIKEIGIINGAFDGRMDGIKTFSTGKAAQKMDITYRLMRICDYSKIEPAYLDIATGELYRSVFQKMMAVGDGDIDFQIKIASEMQNITKKTPEDM